MKKILLYLLLLCSISTFAQAEFPEGIQVTNVQDNTALKVNVQNATGVINWKYLTDFQKEKAVLSTGLIKNGLISANGDPTKFNITAGIGIISNFDDPENPTSAIVNFPAFTGITPTHLLTGTITYVAINNSATVVMQATPFTPEQRRSLIVLGAVVHSNLTTINVINNISAPTNASTNQLHDFIEAVGALNLTGNKYTANGANLQLNKSAGLIFKLGSNFANDWKNPHELAQTSGTSLTFRYRTQNGTEGSDRINLDPALYDLNNVLTSVPNNKFTIQTVTMFQSGVTRIQYGQTVYDDLATAKNAVFTRNFVLEPNSKENGIIRAYIIMKNSTTSLQNVSDADILEAQKFGGVASGGVALTLANIVTALGYTPANDSDAVHKVGAETITGIKNFTASINSTSSSSISPYTGASSGSGDVYSGLSSSMANVFKANISSTGTGKNFIGQNDGFETFGVDKFGNGFFNGSIRTNSNIDLNRNSLTSSAPIRLSTSGTNDWFIGQSPLGMSTKNLSFYSYVTNSIVFDLNQTTGEATFSGIPTAPTATVGTNTTQLATTAFVQANSLALSGNQTLTGRKTFTSDNTTLGGMNISNSRTSPTDGNHYGFAVFNTGGGGVYAENTTAGTNGNAMQVANSSNTGAGIAIGNFGTGIGLILRNQGGTGDLLNAEVGAVIITSAGKLLSNNFEATGTMKMKEYTVATLPTPTGTAYATVTDALTPTYLATVVGGGAVVTPVFYNGSTWVAH